MSGNAKNWSIGLISFLVSILGSASTIGYEAGALKNQQKNDEVIYNQEIDDLKNQIKLNNDELILLQGEVKQLEGDDQNNFDQINAKLDMVMIKPQYIKR